MVGLYTEIHLLMPCLLQQRLLPLRSPMRILVSVTLSNTALYHYYFLSLVLITKMRIEEKGHYLDSKWLTKTNIMPENVMFDIKNNGRE